MDFFDVMFGKKYGAVPFSKNYFDTLFAAKLAQLEIKTLTGTLPLTFRTSETALRSWTIYGNNTQHSYSASGTLPLTFTTHTAGAASDWEIEGNDNVGKNLISVDGYSYSNYGVVSASNAQTGEVIINGTNEYTGVMYQQIEYPVPAEGRYYISGCAVGGTDNTFYCISQMKTTTQTSYVRTKKWDGTTNTPSIYGNDEREVLITSDITSIVFTMAITSGTRLENAVFKPMLRPADTSADFEPYQVGVGQRTENLANVPNQTLTFSNDYYKNVLLVNSIEADTYTVVYDAVTSAEPFSMSIGVGEEYYTQDISGLGNLSSGTISRTFTIPNEDAGRNLFFRPVRYQTQQTLAVTLSNVMLVKGSTAPTAYVPFGYEIPLAVNGTPQDIYIGDSPLTAGQSVSKTSTGVDIAAIAGSNTITTELYNKPEMSIEGVDYVGVGEPINDSWQIPLAVTCDRNLFNIYGNMAYSGGVHLINYNVETSSVTGEMSADSYYILGIANAIVKGDETFVISFDKSTAGTAELRMTKGTGSSAEIIETFDISEIKSYRIVFECEESFGNVYPRLVATEAATNTFEHIMIKKASDKGGFVPYGAKYEYNVPINAPLTEGQSVTDTVTISTFEGENVLDTTLTNKPQMTITYKGG